VSDGVDSRPICYLVVGNHRSHDGIYEIALVLHDVLAVRYRLAVSSGVVPDEINILIDEFSSPGFADYLAELRRRRPGTRYLVLATEFVTTVKVLGIELFKTFNFFGWRDSWRFVADIVLSKFSRRRSVPYFHRRFLGFRALLGDIDGFIWMTPTVQENMTALLRTHSSVSLPNAVLYPIIDLDSMGQKSKLQGAEFGFVMTGTQTGYRAGVFDKLSESFRELHWDVCRSIGYSDQGATFLLLARNGEFTYPSPKLKELFNFNPPQSSSWKSCSITRIYRAAMAGQIPVVTKKFGDHEAEDIAELWDEKKSTAQRLLTDGTIGRSLLIERYLAAVERYNGIAHRKNAAFFEVLDGLRSVPASGSP
jgi:hypothetical protein